jgi:large subunit ribosomal protein L9
MNMTVVLRADVDSLGRVGDQVSVKPGFARNYLIPQGLAILATPSNLKGFEQERLKLEAKANELRSQAASLEEKLNAAEVVIEVRTGENDKLYGSVTSSMIGDMLAEMGIELDRKKIVLDQPIRALGEYKLPVKLHAEVTAELSVRVVKQGAADEPAEVAEEAAEAPVEEAVAEAPEVEAEQSEQAE